jgi:hypothetical protein
MVLNGNGAFQAVNINTGGVSLTSGNQYVALLTVSDPVDYANSNGTSVWGRTYTHNGNNGGGGFVFYNNGNNPGALNSNAWDNFADFGDLAWRANFRAGNNAVPEPGSVAMLIGMSISGLVAVRRRNRK